MSIRELISWIVVGGVAGFLADAIVGGIKVGWLGAVAVGIVGGFIGGWLFAQLGISAGAGLLGSIITAFVGGVILLIVLRQLR